MNCVTLGFWPRRKFPNRWVVVSLFRRDRYPTIDSMPEIFDEKPFNDKASALAYATKLARTKGYRAIQVLPPVS